MARAVKALAHLEPAPKCVALVHGTQCSSYAVLGCNVCFDHGATQGTPLQSAYEFSNDSLRLTHQRMLNHPLAVSVRDELALVKTCLQVLIKKVHGTSLDDVGAESLAVMTAFAKDVGAIAQQLAAIDRGLNVSISIGDVASIIDEVAVIAGQYLTGAQLREFSAKLGTISVTGQRAEGDANAKRGLNEVPPGVEDDEDEDLEESDSGDGNE